MGLEGTGRIDMPDFDQTNQQVFAQLVRAGVRLTGKLLKHFLLWLLGFLAPYLVPILVALLLFAFVYSVMFIVPRYIMDSFAAGGSNTEVVSIFNGGTGNTWTMEFDQELKRQYDELGSRWKDGLETEEDLRARLGPEWSEEIDDGYIVAEFDQAKPYRLPWAVLAAVDRVIGDPVITGEDYFLPQPEKNYEALKPEFTWREVTFTKTIEEVEENYTTIETRTVTADVRLLQQVHAYDATYEVEYQPKTIARGEKNKNQRVTELETLNTIRQQGPYFGPLIDLMNSYGITRQLDIELVLQLAFVYDQDYAADFNLLGIADYGFSIDLTKQYWQGPQGRKTAPLPLEYMQNVTSPYGMRRHPFLGDYRMHSGVDFGAPTGTPVYAFQNGLVIYAGNMGGYGKTVILDHGGFKTQYGHLSRINVRTGQEVTSGDKIGEVGSTGQSTGPHLHFEVQLLDAGSSKPVDPQKYLEGGK